MGLTDHLVALWPGTTMWTPSCFVVANDVVVRGDTRCPTDAQPTHRARLLTKVAIARRKILLARRVVVLNLRRLMHILCGCFRTANMVRSHYLSLRNVVVRHLARHHGMMYRYLLLPLLLRLPTVATLVHYNMPRRQILRQGVPTSTPRLL